MRFTTSYPEAGAFGEVHFVCVGTPQRADSCAADLRHAGAAFAALAAPDALLGGKSAVPAGRLARTHGTEIALQVQPVQRKPSTASTMRGRFAASL
ncbi:hypothetical protein [Streptomyces sp. NPDC006309]|uniref:hypothetical protein n=1 Tax=Streptomyces sp. NPDC006309 TaxID=3156749 RepID=UPI0033A6CF11